MKSTFTSILKLLGVGLLLCLAAEQTSARSTLVRFNLHEAIGLATPDHTAANAAQPLSLLAPGGFAPRQILAGGAYTLNFAAAEPADYIPPVPFPTDLAAPIGSGDGNPLIPLALFKNGAVDVKTESLAPSDMALGQIVPFETSIAVSGDVTPENGVITFVIGWNTLTTNSGDFGYDARADDVGYGVIGAFIDTGDGTYIDLNGDATVESFTWSLINDEIVGVFTVSGLDDGDEVILEAWLVLDDSIPEGIGGNVQSRLIDAATGGDQTLNVANSGAITLVNGDAISTGSQTVPLLKPSDFFTAPVDVSVTKTDDVDPIEPGETLTYTISAQNAGPSIANTVQIVDELDPNVTFVSASDGGVYDAGTHTVTWDIGALAFDPVNPIIVERTLVVTVNNDAPTETANGEDLINTVSISTISSNDTDEANNKAKEPTDVTADVVNILADDNESVTTNEDTPVSGNVLDNVDNPDGGPASVTTFTVAGDATVYNAGETATIAGVGTLVIAADGSYTFTPAADYDGAVPQTTYTVSDGADTVDSTLDIAITPINDLADANELVITDEDTPVSGNVLDNAVDAEGDPLTVTEFTVDGMTYPAGTTVNLTEGDLTLNADGSYTFTPAADYDGAVPQTTYTVSDGTDTVDSTLDIAITPINDLADANESVITDEDTPVSGNVLDNAVDAEGDPLTVTEFTVDGMTYPAGTTVNLTEGDLTLNADGSYTFTPAADYDGAVPQTTYTVSDGTDTVDSTLDIAITPINDLADANESVITDEDTPVSGNVLDNAVDAEGDPLTVTEFTVDGMTYPAGTTVNLTEGDLTLNADGSYTFTPAADYDGAVPQTAYTVSDGTDTVDSTLDIAITPINDLADANESVITDEDTPVSGNVLDNVDDPDGGPASVTTFQVAGDATVYNAGETATIAGVGTLVIAADGSYTFTPAADYDGAVPQTTYTVSDGTDTVDSTLDIEITPVNDFPNASDDSYTVLENSGTITLTPSATDNDDFGGDGPSTGTIAIATSPTNGTVTVNNNGTPDDPTDDTFDYTPNADFNGSDSFTYTITDSNGDESTATVQITVEPVAISIIKTGTFNDEDGDNFADVGETITYNFTVANEGNVILTDVIVTDPKVAVLGGPTTLDIGEIDETTFSGSYTLTQADIDAGGVNNQALATGTDPNGNDVTDLSDDNSTLEDEETITLVPQNPAISIVKSSTFNDENGDGFAQVGETISYMFTVTNNGNVTLTNVTVDDDMVLVFCGAGASNNIGTMAPGDVEDGCIASYTLTQADIDAGSVSNQATATGDDPNGDPVSDDSDSTNPADDTGGDDDPTVTPVPQNPAISIVKNGVLDLGADGMANPGDVITYSFTVANEGNVTLSDVTVSDPLFPVSGGPLATLAVGATDATTFSGTYSITQADIDAGGVENQAVATGGYTDANGDPQTTEDDSDDDSPAEDEPTVTPVPQNPAISIVKNGVLDLGADGMANPGDVITYSFTVANEGNVTLSDVTVSDPLFPVSGGPLATLAVGATDATTFSGTYSITQADIDAGGVENQAVATGGYTDANGDPQTTEDDSDDDSPAEDEPTVTPVPQNPAISIVKNGVLDLGADGMANPGDVITYSFTVANEGNVTLSDVTVSDPLFPVSGGPLATLAVGATDATTFSGTYSITQADIDAGGVENQAVATGGYTDANGDPQTTEDDSDDDSPAEDEPTVTPVPQNPAISIVKNGVLDLGADGMANPGDVITYSFTVANEGNVTLSDVTVSDPLFPVSGGPLATLAVGATDATTFSGTYSITQADIDAGGVENQAVATGGYTDANGDPQTTEDDSDDDSPAEDEPTVTPVPQNPAISIVKNGVLDLGADGMANPGDVITYSFTVANEGNVTLSDVTVSDPLFPVSGGPLATLAVGATDATTFSGTYSITQADIDAGGVENQAVATGGYTDANGDPQTTEDDSDDDSPAEDEPTVTPVPQNPAISIVKNGVLDLGADGMANPGDVITYSFTVANEGNVTLSDVTVSDPLFPVSGGPLATLAVGATDATTFSGTYSITQADIDAGGVENQAVATGGYTDANGDPQTTEDDSDDDSPAEDEPTVTPVPQNPAISIVKNGVLDLGADGMANPGDVITYSFTVANEGNVTLSDVTVSDPLFPVSGGPLATLAVGATDATTFSGTYSITQADIDAGGVENQAVATGGYTDANGDPQTTEDDSDDDSPAEDEPTVTPVPQNPAISIVKNGVLDLGADGMANPGDVITYSFTVANEGNVTLSDVTVSDPLFPVSGGPLATLAVGATDATTFSGTYSITQADIDAGGVENQAVATGGYTDANGDPQTTEDDSDDDSPAEDEPTVTPVPQNPAISIVKNGVLDLGADGMANPGDVITYSFTVANEGNVTLSDVTVSDPLFPVSGGPLATLAVGATDATTFSGTYSITQADIDAGGVENQAVATGGYTDANGDPQTTEDDSDDDSPAEDEPTVTPVPQNPAISIVKTFAADAVTAGGAGSSFTLVVTNAGNVTLSDALIEDLVDSRLEVTSVSGTAGSDADSDGDVQTVEWLITSLAPGASETITVNFTVDASVEEANGVGGLNDADEVPNNATVGAEAPQGDPGDPGDDITDDAADAIDILVDIDLSIVKTFDPTNVPQGTSQSFTIEVSNAGPSDAVDVSVTDMVHTSLEVTGVSHDAATGDCSASTDQDVNCTVNVPAGETVTVTVDYVTAPFLDDGGSPYGTGIGDDFYFVFLNGSILEGSTDGGPVYLDGVDITADVSIVTSLSRNDIVFDPPGPDPAFELHLSCSDPFTDGWGQSGGPVEGIDVNWQIAYFTVSRYSPQGFLKSCGNVVNDFEVPNTAESSGDDSFGTQDVSDDAIVTVGPGITIDKLTTKGKRLTARLTNWTGENKEIAEIILDWPESNGNLTKAWLTYGNTSDVIWEGVDDPTDAVLDAGDPGWNGATLFTGEAILRFDFQNKVADCPYTIRVLFTDGTWLNIDVSEVDCGGAALTQSGNGNKVVTPEQEAAPELEAEIRAFPNPSVADVNIIFSLDRDEEVRLDIYNTLGVRVATLFDGKVRANEQHTVVLRKDQVAYGTYFYRLMTKKGISQGQILILD